MYFIVHAAFVRIKLMMMMMIKYVFCGLGPAGVIQTLLITNEVAYGLSILTDLDDL